MLKLPLFYKYYRRSRCLGDAVFDTYMVSFCGTDSERNMVIKPMQIRTHDSVYIINIAEINNNDRRRFKSRYCSYFLI